MNNLQLAQFEILKEFDRVCKQLDIQYFLVCGSALGAVKYGGFIPWDDDIDVALYREDYEYFIKNAKELLPNNLFVQNYHSEPNVPMIYTKLRNSKTTFIEKTAEHLKINHGIFIDIFPLDGYPKDLIKQKSLEFKKKVYSNLLVTTYNVSTNWKSMIFTYLNTALRIRKNPNRIIKAYEKLICKYSVQKSEIICNHGNWQGKLEYAPNWHYGNGSWVDFEGLSVKVPKNYDAYLTQKYGDWRAELPKDKQVGHHYYEVCDTSKSYLEYM